MRSTCSSAVDDGTATEIRDATLTAAAALLQNVAHPSSYTADPPVEQHLCSVLHCGSVRVVARDSIVVESARIDRS